MPTQAEINDQQKLLLTYRGNLMHYLQQQAQHGSALVPINVVNGIRESREHIRHIKNTLIEWGIPVDNHPDDEDNSGSPGVAGVAPRYGVRRSARG